MQKTGAAPGFQHAMSLLFIFLLRN